jgi:hypothetical protein
LAYKAFSVVSDPEHPGAKRLTRSAKYWGWDHSFIIKQDQPEVNFRVWRPSYRAEQLGQLDFIRHHEPEFCMYVDGWDTVFTGPPQELDLKRGVLTFGGDTVLYPEDTEQPMNSFPRVGWEEFRFLNVGAIWGDSKIMAELAADYLQNSPEQMINQAYYNRRYAFERGVGRTRLHLDSKAEVALNIMLVQKRWFKMEGRRGCYLPTGTHPLVLHSPGQNTSNAGKAVPIPLEIEALYGE